MELKSSVFVGCGLSLVMFEVCNFTKNFFLNYGIRFWIKFCSSWRSVIGFFIRKNTDWLQF